VLERHRKPETAAHAGSITPILLAPFRSLKLISLLSMQKKLAKDIFTLKKDGAKRHQQIFNFQSSIPACPG
jgi:hypothetical protein